MQMAFSSKRKGIGDMSDAEFQDYLSKENKTQSRLGQLGTTGGNYSGSANSGVAGGGSGSSSGNNPLGSFLGGNFSLDSMTDRAKDMARFRLGLDQEQAGFFGGLREKEAQSNFGRQSSFERQQQEGRESLTNITQNALTGRLNSELQNRLTQQDKNIGQQNLATNRAINLASRRLGQ
jgi:hypothetical protein